MTPPPGPADCLMGARWVPAAAMGLLARLATEAAVGEPGRGRRPPPLLSPAAAAVVVTILLTSAASPVGRGDGGPDGGCGASAASGRHLMPSVQAALWLAVAVAPVLAAG